MESSLSMCIPVTWGGRGREEREGEGGREGEGRGREGEREGREGREGEGENIRITFYHSSYLSTLIKHKKLRVHVQYASTFHAICTCTQ